MSDVPDYFGRRADFENWISAGGLHPHVIRLDANGAYASSSTAIAWGAWVVAHAHYYPFPQAPAAPEAPKP